MRKTINLIILFALLGNIAVAQQATTEFLKLSGPYFGQKPPEDIPELFAPGIISTNNHEHSRLVFSSDGNEIFWIVIPVDTLRKNQHGRPYQTNEQNIYYTQRLGDEWTKPIVFPLTKQYTPKILAIDSKNRFYFIVDNQEANPNKSPFSTKLFIAEKANNNWSNPELSENKIPTIKGKAVMTICFAANGNLYFDSGGPNSSGEWSWKIYLSEFKKSEYQTPQLLDFGINDSDINWCPWIAPDESFIIWSSHREGNYGNGDLYISFKNKNGGWSIPRNMGIKINTEGQERFPSVSPDRKYLFFARHKGNITYSDIYWVDAKIIEELKPKELK